MLLLTLCIVLIKVYFFFQHMLWVMHRKHIMYHVLLIHQYIGPVHQCCHIILVMQLILAIFCFTDLRVLKST